MKTAWREPAGWAAILVALSALVAGEGARRTDLERHIPLTAGELYRTLARSQTSWQVVDARPAAGGEYEDAHVPGAVPLPACDPALAPEPARLRVHRGVPTVIVTAGGDADLLRRCLASFTLARGLAGGMEAWSAASLPEDSGPYAPPSTRAGGGCL